MSRCVAADVHFFGGGRTLEAGLRHFQERNVAPWPQMNQFGAARRTAAREVSPKRGSATAVAGGKMHRPTCGALMRPT